jgi:hypothetical protein
VYASGTSTLATLYSDNGVTATANPLTTNDDGEYAFYAANGRYDLVLSGGGIVGETIPDVLLNDPVAADAVDLSTLMYDDGEAYPADSAGERMQALFDLAKTLTGTANEITVVEVDDETLRLELPDTMVAPGSLTVTGQLIGGGTQTNDDAATGTIGEYREIEVAKASAVALTTLTPANAMLLELAPGDWEVEGILQFTGAATTIVYAGGGISLVSASLPGESYLTIWLGRSGALPADQSVVVMRRRVKSAITGNVYLVAQGSFASTMSVYGMLRARRVR